MTPFRNVALICPATIKADAGTHTSVFGAADGLAGWRIPEFGIRQAVASSHRAARRSVIAVSARKQPGRLGWARVDAGQYGSSVQIGAFGTSNPRVSPTRLPGFVVVRRRAVLVCFQYREVADRVAAVLTFLTPAAATPNPNRTPSQNCTRNALGAAGRPFLIAATSIIRRCDPPTPESATPWGVSETERLGEVAAGPRRGRGRCCPRERIAGR
jgi:hypothetical protein